MRFLRSIFEQLRRPSTRRNPLQHPKVERLTPEIANELGLDKTFTRFVFASSRPDCFEYLVEDHSRGWTCFIPDDVRTAYPLWSTNADQTLVLVGDSVRYGQGYHDEAEVTLLANTAQGLLANLFSRLVEGEFSATELRKAAEFAGFRFLDECLSLESTQPNRSSEDWARLIASIDNQADATDR